MLELKNILLSYPNRQKLLQIDHLKLNKGEMVAIMGLNGSGKSSLIRAITAIDRLPQGELLLEGRHLTDIPRKELASHMSVVLTDLPYPHLMPLEEFVAFGRYPFNNWLASRSTKDQEAIEKALDACQLQFMRSKSMGELSDGERQRAMIARTLAQESSLLVLDEPTTHLDGVNTIEVLKLLKEQSERYKKGILFSTHKLVESLQLVDKLWVLWHGKVVEMSVDEFGDNQELHTALLGEHFKYEKESGSFTFNITNKE